VLLRASKTGAFMKTQNNDLSELAPFFELNIWEMSGVLIKGIRYE